MRKIKTIPDDIDENGKVLTASRTSIYYLWRSMRSRCNDPKATNYSYYGGKGVKVCDEWNNSFTNFYSYVSKLDNFNKYINENYSLDRIDNSKGYEPENVRWVSKTSQVINRKNYNKSTGYTGIRYNPKCIDNPYSGRVYFKGKETITGYHTSLEEAVEERNKFIEKNNLPHKKQIFKN